MILVIAFAFWMWHSARHQFNIRHVVFSHAIIGEGTAILLPNLVSFEYHQNSRHCPLELVPMVLSRRISNQPAASETGIQRLQKAVLDFRLEEETKQIVGIPGLVLVYSERQRYKI